MPLLADRVRKARKASTLACGCYVRVGHQIVRVHGKWVCVECLMDARSRHPAGKGNRCRG